MSRVARATHPRAVLRRRTSTQDHQHAHHVLRLCHLRGRARRAHRAPRQQARRERRSDARGSRERRRRRRPERCVSSPLSGTRTRRHRGARSVRRVSRSTRARGANARAAARGASQPRVRARSRGKKSISSHSASHVERGAKKSDTRRVGPPCVFFAFAARRAPFPSRADRPPPSHVNERFPHQP